MSAIRDAIEKEVEMLDVAGSHAEAFVREAMTRIAKLAAREGFLAGRPTVSEEYMARRLADIFGGDAT
jgi:hypothetical protein